MSASERTVYIFYVCCMLKCTLHKYIQYVECVHTVYLEHSKSIDVMCFPLDMRMGYLTVHKKSRAVWWTAHTEHRKKSSAVDWDPFRKQAICRRKRYAEGWTRYRTAECVRSETHTHTLIHFVCIKKKYVYEWRNQFGYLELIINSQI